MLVMNKCFTLGKSYDGQLFLAHRIRISEILPWDRKSYLTHAILQVTSSCEIAS